MSVIVARKRHDDSGIRTSAVPPSCLTYLGRSQFDYVKHLGGHAVSNPTVVIPFLVTMVTAVHLLVLSVQHLDGVGSSSR